MLLIGSHDLLHPPVTWVVPWWLVHTRILTSYSLSDILRVGPESLYCEPEPPLAPEICAETTLLLLHPSAWFLSLLALDLIVRVVVGAETQGLWWCLSAARIVSEVQRLPCFYPTSSGVQESAPARCLCTLVNTVRSALWNIEMAVYLPTPHHLLNKMLDTLLKSTLKWKIVEAYPW